MNNSLFWKSPRGKTSPGESDGEMCRFKSMIWLARYTRCKDIKTCFGSADIQKSLFSGKAGYGGPERVEGL